MSGGQEFLFSSYMETMMRTEKRSNEMQPSPGTSWAGHPEAPFKEGDISETNEANTSPPDDPDTDSGGSGGNNS